MVRRIGCKLILVAAGIGLLLGDRADAQMIKTGRTAFDNLSASYASERVPGSMVAAGFGRAQQSADAARGQVNSPEITETEPPVSIREQFLVDAVQTVLEQLLNTINFLGNRLLARAGLMPLLPPQTFFPDASPDGGGDGSGDSNGDSGDGTDRSRDDRT